jgi:hypothetical protein
MFQLRVLVLGLIGSGVLVHRNNCTGNTQGQRGTVAVIVGRFLGPLVSYAAFAASSTALI